MTPPTASSTSQTLFPTSQVSSPTLPCDPSCDTAARSHSSHPPSTPPNSRRSLQTKGSWKKEERVGISSPLTLTSSPSSSSLHKPACSPTCQFVEERGRERRRAKKGRGDFYATPPSYAKFASSPPALSSLKGEEILPERTAKERRRELFCLLLLFLHSLLSCCLYL